MSSPLQAGQKLFGIVDTLAFGGSGIIRHDGMVLFVPDVLPGESVLVEVTEVKANYAKGKVVSIEQSSPRRITPLCPYNGLCGGCQLQHINPAFHPDIKRQWLKEALHGLIPSNMPIDIAPAQQMWAWRRKISLHARWNGHSWVCGYVGRDNTSIVPVRWCPLFCTEQERELLPNILSLFDGIPGTHGATIDLSLCRLPDNTIAVLLQGTLRLSKATQHAIVQHVDALPYVRTLSLRFPHLHYDRGPTEFTFSALNTQWHFSHEAFIQNHPSQGERLWADVIATVEKGGANQTILDLYSGIGVTAISLALRSHTVTAVELSSAAVTAARRSARALGAHLQIVESTVEEFLTSALASQSCWIVNPPRQGISKEAVAMMIEKRPTRVVYVSCSPPTLARDLRALVQSGRHVASVQAYDLFPQTSNLETIAVVEG
jgi:23S rRNA (uracil1939-C5)-methyltransferase